MEKNLHFLKIYKEFIGAVLMGIMSFEKVKRIAETTWEIECLLKQNK